MADETKAFGFNAVDVAAIDAMNFGQLCDFFVDVATYCPDKASEAVDKLIAFWKMDDKRRGKPPRKKAVWIRMAYERIGYIAGYYDPKTQDLLMSVFKQAEHPVFGRNLGTKAKQVDVKVAVASLINQERGRRVK